MMQFSCSCTGGLSCCNPRSYPVIARSGAFAKSMLLCGFFVLMGLLQTVQVDAQELLIGLGENALVPVQKEPRSKADAPVLEIPFVDDFSKPTNFVPDPLLWDNSQAVFVNTTFAIASPTIGVATFDPFDRTGKIYAHASSRVFAADTLTSHPINLAYPNDSVYLSFFYQPQGHGDMPELTDSLSLEFYNPSTQTWSAVWSAAVQLRDSAIIERNWLTNTITSTTVSGLGTQFFRAHLKVSRAMYLVQGFRFRFINYASITVNSNVPGRSTASDHWNLDYVYLDKGRRADNLNIPDIAITLPQASISKRYESIPAVHLNSSEAQDDLFTTPLVLSVTYTNLGMGVRSVTRNFRIRPILGEGNTISYPGDSENINNGETITFTRNEARYEFTTQEDEAAFEIRSYLATDSENTPFRRALRQNDTTRYVQWFRDYYAYDDGSAENGYGLFGAGTTNGQLAVRFYSFKTDSLRGVYLYFNRAMNDANVQNFKVAVWEDDGSGQPGRLIHSEAGARPVFKDSLNQFVPYRFAKPVHIPRSTNFFVGWIQSSEEFLNIGFDRNRDQHAHAFYNIGAGWVQSMFEGSIMLRPIFCRNATDFPDDYEELGNTTTTTASKDSYLAYPNPARGGVLYLDENDRTPLEASRVELYRLNGGLAKVYTKVNSNIDVSTVEPGIYLLRVWKDGHAREVKKIIVAR